MPNLDEHSQRYGTGLSGGPGGPAGPIGFTISADMTEPLRALCAAVPEAAWALLAARAEETVRCAEVEFTPGDWPKAAWPNDWR